MRWPLCLLRWRGRQLYRSYSQWFEEYGCGRELFEHINPEARRLRLRYETIVGEIKARIGG